MITEQQQEQALRCALEELTPAEQQEFAVQVRANPELREFLRSLQNTVDSLVLSRPVPPPVGLKGKVLSAIQARSGAKEMAPSAGGALSKTAPATAPAAPQGLRFLPGADTGWKPLPVPGAFIKLLSLQADRGYAVLLGKLEPGVRYPAHTNVGPEDFYLLTGDLHVGEQVLGPGDFHHAEAGSFHTENYSVEGCTLLAVLTTDDPLVQLAMAS
jgi:anti-sigma factor ChrR (cupin superfamily)